MFNVLGVNIHAVDMDAAVHVITDIVRNGGKGYVTVTGVHGVIESRTDISLKNSLDKATLNVADGMPLVWFGRLTGHKQVGRVYGPDLMFKICELSLKKNWTHFLYGGKPGVADELKIKLEKRYPGIRIAGTYCPPFRPLNEQEEKDLIDVVSKIKPDFFWVGISTPKQEIIMAQFLDKLDVRIMLGVGAAFDIHSGRMKDVPAWMKDSGFQWFYRLCQEPRRLWRRYCYIVPVFLFLVALQLLGLRNYNDKPR